MRIVKIIKSNAGMGLVEVMVAAGILTVVTMGVATTISQSMKSQNATGMLNFLATEDTNLTRVIQDGAAWSYTIAAPGNSSLSCLTTGSCSQSTAGQYPQSISVLYDSTNKQYFPPSGYNGFTPGGTPCNTFVSQTTPGVYTGVDACPISYTLAAHFDCPGGSGTCNNPVVTVRAQLVYNPSAKSPYQVAVNLAKYTPIVVRGAGNYVRNDAIFIAQQQYNVGPSAASGGGTCGMSAAATTRDYTSAIGVTASNGVPIVDTASSTGGYVSGGGTGAGNIISITNTPNPNFGVTLRAGGYVCDISAVAWAVNGWSLQVYLGSTSTNPIAQDSSYAKFEDAYAQSEINLQKIHLDLPTNTLVIVTQTCQTNATIASNAGQFKPEQATAASQGYAKYSMGIPIANAAGGYGTSVFSSISCTRVY